jgi:bifunctional DNA-binding transcriptional regulator/antitoxin component of YhaV-PrlF toxin-antitoxin module
MAMTQTSEKIEVMIEGQGCVVIPAELCKAIGGLPGETLIAYVEDGKLVLEQRNSVLARVRARFSEIPADVSLSDELIQERRAEAREENEREPI